MYDFVHDKIASACARHSQQSGLMHIVKLLRRPLCQLILPVLQLLCQA